jgi:hypothetical protein
MKNHWLLTVIILIAQLGAPAVRADAVRMCPVEVITTTCDQSEAVFCEIGGVEPTSDLGGIDTVAPAAGGIGGAIAALFGGGDSSTPSTPQTANAATTPTSSAIATGATAPSTPPSSLQSEEPVKAVPAPPAFIGLLVFGGLAWMRSRRSKGQNQSNSVTES